MSSKSRYFEVLAAEIAAGVPIRQAAAKVSCCESTAYRMAATTEFKTRVSELRSSAMDLALGQLSEASSQAVATMVELLESDDDSVRLRASTAILDRFSKISEQIDLRTRIEEVEKALAKEAQQ